MFCFTIFKLLPADNLDRSGNEDNQIHLRAFQTGVSNTLVNEKWNESLQPLMSTAQQSTAPTVKPRRELVWKAAYGRAGNIRDISQQYQRLLALQSHSGSRQALRRYRDLSKPQTYHRCKGYSREEVTLTHAAFDSKIVIHDTPSVHEVCLVCGEHIAEDLSLKLSFKCHCEQCQYIRVNCLVVGFISLLNFYFQRTMAFPQIFSAQNALHGNMRAVRYNYEGIKMIMSAWTVES